MLNQMNDSDTFEAIGCLNDHNGDVPNEYGTNGGDINDLMEKLKEYKFTIEKLSQENERVLRHLQQLEEQNTDIIGDKMQLENELQMQREYYDKRIEKLMREINDLTRNVQLIDAMRLRLENQLTIKGQEKNQFQTQLKALNKKLTDAENNLILMKNTEESLISACRVSNEKCNEMTSSNIDVIEQLHETTVKCAQQNQEIHLLNNQMEMIKFHMKNKDIELMELKTALRNILEISFLECGDGTEISRLDSNYWLINHSDDTESVVSHSQVHNNVEYRVKSASVPVKSKCYIKKTESLFEELHNACPEFTRSTPEWRLRHEMGINCDTEISRMIHKKEHLECVYFDKVQSIITEVSRRIFNHNTIISPDPSYSSAYGHDESTLIDDAAHDQTKQRSSHINSSPIIPLNSLPPLKEVSNDCSETSFTCNNVFSKSSTMKGDDNDEDEQMSDNFAGKYHNCERRKSMDLNDSVEITIQNANTNVSNDLIKTINNQSSPKHDTETLNSFPTANDSANTIAFPSLPDAVLRKLQLLRENCLNPETLTEPELESKFNTLALAFKTDKFTLDQRLELQRHHRDVAESDARKECDSLRNSVILLNQLIATFEDDSPTKLLRPKAIELLSKIESNIDIIVRTNEKISSRSELFGAVRQEERLSAAFDVIMIHTENLKRARDREHRELQDTRMSLSNHHGNTKKTDAESDSESDSHVRRHVMSVSSSLNLSKMNLIRVRRASVASVEIITGNDVTRRTVSPHINGTYQRHVQSSNAQNNTVMPSEVRSRRRSMPASPTQYHRYFDNEQICQLETTEEHGSESECGSSGAANPDSDEESERTAQCVLRSDVGLCDSPKPESVPSSVPIDMTVSPPPSVVSPASNLLLCDPLNSNEKVESNSFNDHKQKELRKPHLSHDDACDNSDSDKMPILFPTNGSDLALYDPTHTNNSGIMSKIYNFCINCGLTDYMMHLLNAVNYQQIRYLIATLLIIVAALVIVVSLLPTNLPPYTSWDEIVYRVFLPYLSKEKVSKTQ